MQDHDLDGRNGGSDSNGGVTRLLVQTDPVSRTPEYQYNGGRLRHVVLFCFKSIGKSMLLEGITGNRLPTATAKLIIVRRRRLQCWMRNAGAVWSRPAIIPSALANANAHSADHGETPHPWAPGRMSWAQLAWRWGEVRTK